MSTNEGDVMEIIYKRDHSYSANDVKELFLSVDRLSVKYPERLKKALYNCETVITAWVSGKVVGLINAIDDRELLKDFGFISCMATKNGILLPVFLLLYIAKGQF